MQPIKAPCTQTCLSEYLPLVRAYAHHSGRISVAILISFVARALSTIPGQYFCYEAISSSGVVLILPGYLIRTSGIVLTRRMN